MSLRHSVHLADLTNEEIKLVKQFIKESNLELIEELTILQQDLSDYSGSVDTISEYWFTNEKDAMLFTLRWRCHRGTS